MEVVKRYANMGANQFVKEFRRKWQVKKAMAHRQMVMARKDKRVQQEAKVPVSEIIADQSDHKERSHHRMKELISKFGDAILRKSLHTCRANFTEQSIWAKSKCKIQQGTTGKYPCRCNKV